MKSVPSPSSSHVQDEKKWSLADGGQRKQSNVFPQRFITFIYINDLQVNHLKLSPADRIIFYKLPRFHSIVFTLLSCQIHFQTKKNKTKLTSKQKNQHETLLSWILEKRRQEDHSKSVSLLGAGEHMTS